MTSVLKKRRFKEERKLPELQRETILLYVDRSVPDRHKIATQRALLGQGPRSLAIRIKCLQCCNYEREEVVNCTVLTCALHAVRPYQDKNTPDEETNDE